MKSLKHFTKIRERDIAIKFSLLILLVTIVVGTGMYVLSAKKSTHEVFDRIQKSRESYGAALKTIATLKQDASWGEAQAEQPPQAADSNHTASVPFNITKVHFAQVPKQTSGPETGKCVIGDTVEFQATAQVTATTKGSMEYHWEVAEAYGDGPPGPDDTVLYKKDNQVFSFVAAGTKNVTSDFEYKVRDTGYGGLHNRIFINLVVTSPNNTYANKDKPVHFGPFVYGTYIDLC